MTMPSWVPEIEDKPAPMPLLLAQSFVNTLDRGLGTDVFAKDDDARAWLVESGLLTREAAERATASDLDVARQARESIRALIGRDRLTAAELAPLESVLAVAQPPLDVTADGQILLCPGPADRLMDGLVILLIVIRDAQGDGTWDRLKLCGNPDCRWAFYDRTHSRRGMWCDMATCGNRIKNRNLRARQRQNRS